MTAMDKILIVNSSKWTETNLLSLFMFETNVLFFSPPIIRAASPQRNDAERGRYRQHLHAERHYLCQQCLPVAQSSRWICLRTVHHLSAIRCGCKDFKQSCKTLGDFFFQPKIFPSTTADDMDRITIENGMKDIGSGTCVKFVPRTHEASFLDIQPRYGWVHVSVFGCCFLFSASTWHSDDDTSFLFHATSCWSFLGQTGGSQTLSLQTPGCMWSGVAAHELMHALGFVHEQSRSDRDQYVTIMWKNIVPGRDENQMSFFFIFYFFLCLQQFFLIGYFSFEYERLLMCFQNKGITSENSWPTISIVLMTMALSCIMEGELIFGVA